MALKKVFIFLVLITICHTILYAQQGNYFITHHAPPRGLVDIESYQVQQDSYGEIWIANKQGLLRYDGKEWVLYSTESAVFEILLTQNNQVYFGGRGVFGRLNRDSEEKIQLIDSALFRALDVIDLLELDNSIIVATDNQLFSLDIESQNLDSLTQYLDFNIEELFIIEGLVYLKSVSGDWYYLENEELFEASIDENVVWMEESEGQNLMLVYSNQVVSLSKGEELIPLSLDEENESYLLNSGPQQGKWITEELIAISTLSGGVVFINSNSGKVSEIVNYRTGLPDNEVIDILLDKESGLWVLHEYGLSRIAPTLPIRDFSKFPGLDGNVLQVANFQNSLYVATSTGLYLLDEVRDYSEEVYYEKVERKVETSPQQDEIESESSSNEQEIPDSVAETEKKGLFGFLRKKDKKEKKRNRRSNEREETKEDEEQEVESDTTKTGFFSNLFGKKEKLEEQPAVTEEEWIRKTRRELQAIRYRFKKLNIPAKVEYLGATGPYLFAGSLAGLYEVKDTSVMKISSSPVSSAFYSQLDKTLLVATTGGEKQVFRKQAGRWNLTDTMEDDFSIISQFMQVGSTVWMVGNDSLYLSEYFGGRYIPFASIPTINPYFEQNLMGRNGEESIIVNTTGIYAVDLEKKKLVAKDSLNYVSRYLSDNQSGIWYKYQNRWQHVGSDLPPDFVNYLNIFSDIRFITPNGNDEYYVVTEDNNIYSLDLSSIQVEDGFSSIFLKDIIDPNGNVYSPNKKLDLVQGNNSITFKFIHPEYVGLSNIIYRYRLVGLEENWSEWSENNNWISFPYLPAGKYTLEAQSMDFRGRVENMVPYEFRIYLPYWQRPWFYILEVVLFSLLLYFSIRLNREPGKFRLVSRLLAFLTLIIIVEFVQTIAEYYFETETSPVLNFFIQVIVAVMVLPFEGILRRLIFRKEPEK